MKKVFKNIVKKPSFGIKMRDLKEKRAKEVADKRLLEQFLSQPSLEAKIQQHLVMPIDVTGATPIKVITEPMTPLERTIQRLREISSNL